MPEPLEQFEFSSSPGRPAKWDRYMDGSPWRFTAPADFADRRGAERLRRAVAQAARNRGLSPRTQSVPSGFVFQAFERPLESS